MVGERTIHNLSQSCFQELTSMHRFVPYYRVSSINHGRRGFGLKDQRGYLRAYLKSIGSTKISLARDHVELKSAKSLARRPELAAALEKCRKNRATLLIARLQLLSRDATFLFALLDTQVKFVACDMPRVSRAHIKQMALEAVQAANRNSVRSGP
jgi:DNA invertase Pin-like site-specific DNA recombinase